MEVKEAFKFCLRCGSKVQLIDNHLHCAACGLDHYFNPKPVQSVILLNNKNEALFAVRAVDPQKGYLDFPGGFVEENENFEESVVREVKEELGIEINANDLHYLRSDYDDYPFQNVSYKVMGVAFYADLPKKAKIKPADDVADVEFYKLDEIPLERLAWPSMHKMIDKLKAIKS